MLNNFRQHQKTFQTIEKIPQALASGNKMKHAHDMRIGRLVINFKQ